MSHAMTATGPVPLEALGLVLAHEHVLIDVTVYWDPASDAARAHPDQPVSIELLGRLRRDPVGVTRQNLVLDDAALAGDELAGFKSAGGTTIVDLTPLGAGRRVADVAAAAAGAGVRVVFGTGIYLEETHPAAVRNGDVDDIADMLERDLTEGIDGGPVRAGIIGEIGTSDPIGPGEAKVLRAAARAQRRTGAAINVHLEEWGGNGLAVLDILEDAGADPGRVVLSHLDSRLDTAYHRSLAARGAYVEYDLFGTEEYRVREGRFNPSDRERVDAVRRLIDAGYGEQILLSTDVCTKTQLERYGGYGYGHLLVNVVPMLHHAGIDGPAVDMLLRDNPARVLALDE